MPIDLKKSTSIEFVRYLAKRYKKDVLVRGFKKSTTGEKYRMPTGIGLLHRELEQYRPPGLKSEYARNLERYILSRKDLNWVWWH